MKDPTKIVYEHLEKKAKEMKIDVNVLVMMGRKSVLNAKNTIDTPK